MKKNLISKNLDLLSSISINLSLIICNLIHINKNKKFFNFKFSGISNYFADILSSNYLNNVRFLFAITFVIFASFANKSGVNIELLSYGHIGRILFAFGILFLTIYSNSLFLKKMFITLLPVSVLYFGLVFSSIFNNINNSKIYNINNILSKKCLVTKKSFSQIYQKFMSRGERRFWVV